MILEGKAFFSCQVSVWREDVMAEVDLVEPIQDSNSMSRTSFPWPLSRFNKYVVEYTGRELTYQSDALNAFLGIGNMITPSMANSRLFHGIPAVAFDWALLWNGNLNQKNLRRRHQFPSWAWAGWQGQITMASTTFESHDSVRE